MRRLILASCALLAMFIAAPFAAAQSTLRVVMHADLKVFDPVWSGAYIVRNHGYMVYDTLFSIDITARSVRFRYFCIASSGLAAKRGSDRRSRPINGAPMLATVTTRSSSASSIGSISETRVPSS